MMPSHEEYISRIPNVVFNYLFCTIAGIFIEQAKRENFLQYNSLNELDQQKNRIISILSHDLSAPLTSLSGLVTLCKNKYIGQQEFVQHLPNVENRLENATFLLHNLVRWSKSQLDGFIAERKRVNLAEIVAENTDLFTAQAKEKDIVFRVNVHGVVMGDREMLRLIVRNLLSNAVKFSYPHETIEIETVNKDQTFCLYIVNKGPGLNPSVVAKLFTFQMTPQDGTRREKGTGLGLAISHSFALLNESRLVYRSDSTNAERTTFGLEWNATPDREGDVVFNSNHVVYEG